MKHPQSRRILKALHSIFDSIRLFYITISRQNTFDIYKKYENTKDEGTGKRPERKTSAGGTEESVEKFLPVHHANITFLYIHPPSMKQNMK